MANNHNPPTHNVVVGTKYGSNGSKTFWTTIGSAWPTKNGGFSIKLKALPIGGECCVFPITDKEERTS